MELKININGDALEEVEVMAEIFGLQVPSMLEHCLDLGISMAIVSELSKRKQEKKERSKERKEQKKNIYINIYTSLEGGLGETFLACPENTEKKKRRTSIPREWVEAADIMELPLVDMKDILRLAKKHNFYPAAAKEIFVSFVNHHASKGSRFKDWKRAWTTWITNQKRFNPELMGKRSDSVIRSYETKKPLEGVFNDK